MFADSVTVINNQMSTDIIGCEFSLGDSGKCDNRIPLSRCFQDAHTLNSEPMSEDDDNDNALLEQCINDGIENLTTLNIIDDEELDDDVEEELLSQCIAAGIKMSTICKSQMPVKINSKYQDVYDLTEVTQQHELLESGIKNNKRSIKNKCDNLSDNKQDTLLKNSIATGMRRLHKNNSKQINDDLSVGINPLPYKNKVTGYETKSIASISSICSEMVNQSNGAQNLTVVDDLLSSEMISDPDYSNPNRIRYPSTFKQDNMEIDR